MLYENGENCLGHVVSKSGELVLPVSLLTLNGQFASVASGFVKRPVLLRQLHKLVYQLGILYGNIYYRNVQTMLSVGIIC